MLRLCGYVVFCNQICQSFLKVALRDLQSTFFCSEGYRTRILVRVILQLGEKTTGLTGSGCAVRCGADQNHPILRAISKLAIVVGLSSFVVQLKFETADIQAKLVDSHSKLVDRNRLPANDKDFPVGECVERLSLACQKIIPTNLIKKILQGPIDICP